MRKLAHISVWFICGIITLIAFAGCEFFTGEKKPAAPQPIEYQLTTPYKGVKTLAVAPTVNLSGSHDFDGLAVSDLLYEELQQVGGLNALPLNKTLAAMQRAGIHSIDSPQVAQRLAAYLGADGIIIPAITSYDPYNPPKVGMILQLYTASVGDFDTAATQPAVTTIAASNEKQPVSHVAAVFNASNQTVLRELRDFAAGRTQRDSALQDEKFLLDADAYTRFVCHAMVRRLMEVEKARVAGR